VDESVEARLVSLRPRRGVGALGWSLSRIGDGVPVLAAASLLLKYRSRALPTVALGVAWVLVLNYGVKRLFARPRPLGEAHTSSFPSGHTATAVTAAALAPVAPLAFAATAAISTGSGRVVRGAHWFSDVVAGATLGALAGWALRTLLKRSIRR
jgi:membrane-associated phospholipid phosphatase